MRHELRLIFVILLGLTACSDDTVSRSIDPQAAGMNPDGGNPAQSRATTLELTMVDRQTTMTVFSCTGAGSQFQAFNLAAAIVPGDSSSSYVGLTAFEMAEVADRPLSRNVLVTISLTSASGTERDLWTSQTIDSFLHEESTLQVSGSATGERYRWNPDGTQILEAPVEIDNGEPRSFQITAQCP
jgi:hypothetical protein